MNLFRVEQLLLVAALVLLRLTGPATANGSDCPDQYVYTKQPPAEIFVCNPYINRQLKMSCSVLGQNVTDIKWWFAPGFEEEDATILTNSSKHFLNRMLVAGGLEVQLTVRDLDDEDVGTYWCQASAIDSHGVQLLSTSEVVFLQAKDYFGDIPNSCNFFLMNAGTRCASILVTETVSVVPTTSPEPFTSSVSLTSQPTPTNLPSLFGTHPPSIPTAVVPPTWSILEGSSGILYAVLGLVGFLAIVCISLTVIVVVLCRRRCAKAEIKGNGAEKAIGFEQFSNQSDLPPLYKHDVTSRIIHSDTHSRTLSGEYAEIGPALSMSLERGYSLIGVAHTSLPPVPTELDPETDQIPNPGYENPYDLPMFSLAHKSRQTDILSSKSQEAGEGTNSGSQSLGSHEYHMLEQIAPLSSATSPLSAVSPHHTYHTLEDPNAHSRSCDIIDCSVPVASVSPDIDDNTIIVPQETFKSPRLSSSSVTTEPGGRLPTIPECETENQTTLERSDIVCPSRPSDTNSPDITAANRGGDCTGFSDSSTDDREYDKLVDPPHLYHILEHSPLPGCPRVCDFAPAVYDNLEAGHAVKRKANLLPHVHFLNPQAGVANLTYSSGSSLDASETNVFDDPQYLVSSPGRTRVVKLTCSADRRRELKRSHSYTHGRSPRLYPCQADTQDDTVSSKYSGDYERDPVYMQQLCNGCEERDQSNDLKIRRPPRVMDDSYFWQDDSGFSTFDGSRLSLQDREKGSSLPNLTKHIYQSLETETLEPLQPYDKLDKSRKETAT